MTLSGSPTLIGLTLGLIAAAVTFCVVDAWRLATGRARP